MRLALALALIVSMVTAPLTVASAADRDRVLPDRAFSGPGWRFRDVENFREQFRQEQRRFRRAGDGPVVVVPQVVFVSPGRCWQAGYWDYQWVSQAYPYDAWVPGAWSPDGYWIEGHYETAWYNGGYYQPYWVDGYWSRC
jgi:hypothetical protein